MWRLLDVLTHCERVSQMSTLSRLKYRFVDRRKRLDGEYQRCRTRGVRGVMKCRTTRWVISSTESMVPRVNVGQCLRLVCTAKRGVKCMALAFDGYEILGGMMQSRN